jgi:enhancer of yellow 2 transcription factor
MDLRAQELKAKVDALLVESGDIDSLKDVLRSRLTESGWKDEVRLACNKIIKERGVQNVSIESLVKEVTPIGREKVPAAVKKELLQRINSAVQKHLEIKS